MDFYLGSKSFTGIKKSLIKAEIYTNIKTIRNTYLQKRTRRHVNNTQSNIKSCQAQKNMKTILEETKAEGQYDIDEKYIDKPCIYQTFKCG